MNQAGTELQDQRQNEYVQTQAQAAVATPLQDNGGTDASKWLNVGVTPQPQQNLFQPPTQGEIHKQMWVGSFMLALAAGLASGNASAAIVGGLWGAIGIHDYGNTLRQRASQTDALQKQGYSIPAIMAWYEDGDTKGLDKERDDMLADKREASREKEFDQRMTMEDKRMVQQDEHFNAQMGMQEQRFNQMAAHQGAMERVAEQRLATAGQAGGWGALGHLNSLGRALYAPYRTRVENLNNKQNYVDQLQTALVQMGKGNPVSFNAVLTGLAGMDNPNAVPKEGAIERLEDVGGLPERLKNSLARQKGGVFSADAIQQLQDFAAAHQADIDTQRQKIATAVTGAAAGQLAGAGIADPSNHLAQSVALQVSAGQVADDPNAPQAPQLMSNDQQTQNAEGKPQHPVEQNAGNQKEYPGAPEIGTVEDGYRYKGGNPADKNNWEQA